MNRRTIKLILKIAGLATLAYFLPFFMLFYITCGLYDVSRNRPLNRKVIYNYFFSKGWLIWTAAPLNILLDLVSLPYVNKGVYKLEDLPEAYQSEIKKLISITEDKNLESLLDESTKGVSRAMIYFKWYLKNIENDYNIPEFHDEYKYITTIGVSVFNKKSSTAAHFGPFRASLRVLYNVNNIVGREAYIDTQNVRNYWSENKLFIFDDTLYHQSFNKTDHPRHCLFVDIIRPTYLPKTMRAIVRLMSLIFLSVNSVFIQNWKKK